jgi:hypothetical protein
MHACSAQDEGRIQMLVTRRKAITSLIGCNISAFSSLLCEGSITKIAGSVICPALCDDPSDSAFYVHDARTKLFAQGKSSTIIEL